MTSVTPCSRSRASWKARKGRLRSGTTGLARARVRGRSRVPWPPARITACVRAVTRSRSVARNPGLSLVDEHDRDVVADGIRLAARRADDPGLFEDQIALAGRTHQDGL